MNTPIGDHQQMRGRRRGGRTSTAARFLAAAAVVTVTAAITPEPVTAAATTAPAATTAAELAVGRTSATATIRAAADTYVVAEQPTLAYGDADKLTAATWPAWHTEAYLRFAPPAPPVGRIVAGARVEVTFQRLDHQPSSVELRALTGTWDERTTYATRPATGAVLAGVALPAPRATTATFDVTAAVRAGRTEFAMTNPTPQSVASVYSREHGSDGPRLIIEYGRATLCGASFTTESDGETYQQALAREDESFGGLDAVRVFYPGLPKPWPGKLDVGDRPMVVSFKALPAEVLAGTHDAAMRDWFAAAPRGRDLFWTYFHEPEDDIAKGAFTAVEYRRAWQHIAALADAAGNDRLQATLILMGWSLDPASGRDWREYYPGRDVVDVLGWDQYNTAERQGRYRPAADLFANIVVTSRAENLPFGVAELGSGLVGGDGGQQRAAWLREVAGYLANQGALFALYFDLDWTSHDGPDYRLRDEPSTTVWREFCG